MKKVIVVLPLLVVLLFNAPGWGAPVVESGSGTSAAAITPAVDTFRASLITK